MESIKHLHRSNTMLIIGIICQQFKNCDLVYDAHNGKIIH